MGGIFQRMFERRERSEKQDEFWVAADKLPAAAPSAFYRKLNATLEKMGFARKVWAICEPAYADPSRGGRPGIDPARPPADLPIPLLPLGGVSEDADDRIL